MKSEQIKKLYIYVSNGIRTGDMLTVTTNEDSKCAKLLGLTGNSKSEGGLICNTTSLLVTPEGEGYDTCSFYFGPSDSTIFAFGESGETCGSVAFSTSGESCGSIAFSTSGESCGSIASTGGSFSCGGGCNYAC